MDSTKTSRAVKDTYYIIINSRGEALAKRRTNYTFYFTQMWSNEIEKWRSVDAAKDGLTFYLKRAKEIYLNDEAFLAENYKIMKASIVETYTESIVIEDADDVDSSRQ